MYSGLHAGISFDPYNISANLHALFTFMPKIHEAFYNFLQFLILNEEISCLTFLYHH